jgi:phospholipase C
VALPQHIIVIAFENRSFDHALGFLPPELGGDLIGDEYNLVDPSSPSSERVYVTRNAGPITPVDPCHDFPSVDLQLYGDRPEHARPAPMSGFVQSYLQESHGDLAGGRKIMDCHTPESLPVLSTLARQYCLCTRWFSAVPGPTWPNRYFMHAATSRGTLGYDTIDVPTIYDRIEHATPARTWRIYFGDIPQSAGVRHLAETLVGELLNVFHFDHFHRLHQFFDDLKRGDLPNYTFLEPSYFDTPLGPASDEHPPHDTRVGEALLAQIYNALIASDYWQDSLLLVTYDEHGGFYDSVSPPVGVPAPDECTCANPTFDFTRLGVRVPTILISPLIPPHVDDTVYEHASIVASTRTLFGLGPDSALTRRDASANTFEHNLGLPATRARTDAAPFVLGPHHQLEAIAPHVASGAGFRQILQHPHLGLSPHQQGLLSLVGKLL